jgi:methionyl-tRNA formyltransferase
MQLLHKHYDIVGVATARETPEYSATSEDFGLWAQERGILTVFAASQPDLDAFCRSVAADLAVSVNYPSLISQSTIDHFPLGILNAHGGDLPRYRGNACQAWAIINGESQIGLCVHRMIGGHLDAGDILARAYLELDDDTYVGDCLDWIGSETPSLFLEAVRVLEESPYSVLERQSTNLNDSLRCFPRRPEDGRIDWKLPARDIQRLVRASSHRFSGAYGYVDGHTVRVWRAELVNHHQPYVSVPGQVLLVGQGYVDVACGEAGDLASGVALRISDFTVDSLSSPAREVFRSVRQRLT